MAAADQRMNVNGGSPAAHGLANGGWVLRWWLVARWRPDGGGTNGGGNPPWFKDHRRRRLGLGNPNRPAFIPRALGFGAQAARRTGRLLAHGREPLGPCLCPHQDARLGR